MRLSTILILTLAGAYVSLLFIVNCRKKSHIQQKEEKK